MESKGLGPWSLREAWSLDGPKGARRFASSGTETGERPTAWTIAAALGPGGEVTSFDLQVRPPDRPSEVTTMAFRCFGGRAFGTTIGPGGVPERTENPFPQGSAFRGYSVALDGLVATSAPLRLGHGRRLLVIETDAVDLVPRIRDWMLLAVGKKRPEGNPAGPYAMEFEFRPAEAPARAQLKVLAGSDGAVHQATRAGRAGSLDIVPTAFVA